ncbi:SusC/RagA family TonB-linked outer membrane protein [Chitinophaga cymbidii]|uniref:SusC/RagA family TonB-linked outer membrane protein n=1 Tax=Chitinophaga cymbidii TaxID=1096750 RepID=A0A512RJJ7_9BACT|nr:TonB-dependent receptor [Chitinophaga cymbidii]GEP95876.1 SusC/RagA family TonB-linked outer membrane protein [Chitinophaga cymbidii]
MKKLLSIIILLLFCLPELFAQSREITGKVVDDAGEVLIGANVMEKGTNNRAITDPDGRFKLTVSGNTGILQISYIGYVTQELPIKNISNFNIRLASDATKLGDIVVVGYGTQKKASVVGAISQVDAEELQKSSTPNLTNAIAGRVSGVVTIMGAGKPGSDNAEIYVRGMATTNTTAPLVLVDGLEREWRQIDPTDIETFSVLKDASATAAYGVRGANGVILITTKRGIKGRPVLSLSTQAAVQEAIRIPEYLGSYDFAMLTNEALKNEGKPAEYSASDLEHYRLGNSPYTHPDNDYYRDFVRDGSWQQMSNLSVRGGNEVLGYFISANHLHQEGLYKEIPNSRYETNSNFERFSFRSNLDFTVNPTLKVGVDLTGRFEVRKQPNFGEDLFDKLRRLPPNWAPYINPDGSIGGRSDETRLSPYALLSQFGNRNRNTNVLEGAFKATQDLGMFIKGLSFRTLIGFNSNYESRRDIVEKPELWEYTRFGDYILNKSPTELSISTGKGPGRRRQSFEGAFNYNRAFDDHAVTGMILYQQSQYFDEGRIPTGYLGWVGRATYAYRSKYLFEVNAGYNGSRQFDPSRRFGFFPAVSMGWVPSEERFWKDNIHFVNYLKIRGSYGEIGNDKIGDFSYLYEQRYIYAPNEDGWKYFWGENPNSERGIIEGQPGNAFVTWERAKKSNIGFDAKMMNSKISVTADVFLEKRRDILAIPYSIPLLFGMNNPQNDTRKDGQGLPPENIGRVTNKGIDFEVSYNDKVGAFTYFIKGNFTFARNVIERIDEEGKRYDWQRIEGKQIGQHFGLTDMGLYSRNDFEQDGNGELLLEGGFPVLKKDIAIPSFGVVYPGDIRYKDLNGDGIIDSYDVGAIGKGKVPQHIYGISFGGSYRNVDVNILLQGAGGADMYFREDAVWEFFALGKVMQHHLGRYNPDDPSSWDNATYPRLHPSENTNNHRKSTYWLYSRNYIRLKNVEVGYNLSKAMLSKIKISSARIFANGTNLLTFDDMLNWDPESGSETGNSYPQFRTWNFGIRVSL